MRKANCFSFLFIFLIISRGFGPNVTPPPFHRGELFEPARARPVPFCFQGLRPPPLTSLRVFVELVNCDRFFAAVFLSRKIGAEVIDFL